LAVDGKNTVMKATNYETYANDAPRPVAGLNFTRLLVAVDFSVCTLEMLRCAEALAEQFAAVVDVLHVVPFYHPIRHSAVRPAWGLAGTLKEDLREQLKKTVGLVWANEARVQVSVRVREGRAGEVILREAAFTNASLIILGTRERSWLSRLWRRHTVKRVVQDATCPVMVLRAGRTSLGAGRMRSSSSPAPSLQPPKAEDFSFVFALSSRRAGTGLPKSPLRLGDSLFSDAPTPQTTP